MNPKKERDIGGGVDRSVLGEAHLHTPSAAEAPDRADGQLQAGSEEAQLAAGDVAGLAVELGTQGPCRTGCASNRQTREPRGAVRRPRKYFIAEGLRHSKLRRELPFRPA